MTICTVIGFPLGYNDTATKVFEATRAVENGAKELDMVVNLGDVKAGYFQQVTAEIQALKKVAGKLVLDSVYMSLRQQGTPQRNASDLDGSQK